MLRLNLPHNISDKLKAIRIPTIDRARLVKFLNEAFFDLHEDESPEHPKPKVKSKG